MKYVYWQSFITPQEFGRYSIHELGNRRFPTSRGVALDSGTENVNLKNTWRWNGWIGLVLPFLFDYQGIFYNE